MDTNVGRVCPACGLVKEFAQVAEVERQASDSFKLFHCPGCGFLFVDPVPLEQEYFHGEMEWPPVISEERKRKKTLYFEAVLGHLKAYLSSRARILDFGCGYGLFLACAKKAGFLVMGVDVSPGCREYIATELPDVNAYPFLSELPDDAGSFDLITLFECLYYMPDPRQVLRELQQRLRPGGKIFIAVSANRGWLIALLSYLGRSPLKLKANGWLTAAALNGRAYYAFSSKSLPSLLKSMGFVDIHLIRVSAPELSGVKYRIPRFFGWLCLLFMRMITAGAIDLDMKLHIVATNPLHKKKT